MNILAVRPENRITDTRYDWSSRWRHLVISLFLFAGATGCSGLSPPANAAQTDLVAPSGCYQLVNEDSSALPLASGDNPVCPVATENLNRYCAEPPQYNKRKVHPDSVQLSEPSWTAMSAADNIPLIRTMLAPYRDEDTRARVWEANKTQIESLARSGVIKLSSAVIQNADLQGGIHTIYRLENIRPTEPEEGFNQAHIMFSAVGAREPSPLFSSIYLGGGDAWMYQGRWYLAGYSSLDQRFLIRALSRPRREGPVAGVNVCTIKYVDNRQGVRQP
jgi:hypothetical protein